MLRYDPTYGQGSTGAICTAQVKADGSVVTWGIAQCGGDSSSVAAELSAGVDTVVASRFAFAALKRDGSVVTWGDPFGGGNSTDVAAQLLGGVRTVVGTAGAFAAAKS